MWSTQWGWKEFLHQPPASSPLVPCCVPSQGASLLGTISGSSGVCAQVLGQHGSHDSVTLASQSWTLIIAHYPPIGIWQHNKSHFLCCFCYMH